MSYAVHTATPVPTEVFMQRRKERKDTKAAKIYLAGLCAFASFFAPLCELFRYVSA
jgi:hypothetical protein